VLIVGCICFCRRPAVSVGLVELRSRVRKSLGLGWDRRCTGLIKTVLARRKDVILIRSQRHTVATCSNIVVLVRCPVAVLLRVRRMVLAANV
jgi:hypothetical protein